MEPWEVWFCSDVCWRRHDRVGRLNTFGNGVMFKRHVALKCILRASSLVTSKSFIALFYFFLSCLEVEEVLGNTSLSFLLEKTSLFFLVMPMDILPKHCMPCAKILHFFKDRMYIFPFISVTFRHSACLLFYAHSIKHYPTLLPKLGILYGSLGDFCSTFA